MTDEKFPYEIFTFRLDINEGKEKRVCWFECKEHVDKFVKRHKLTKNNYILTIKEDK
jgi:hypothetical protein